MTSPRPGVRRPAWKPGDTGATGATLDTYVRRLIQEACDLTIRVRDEYPADIHYDLDHKTDPELIALVITLAAMVPDDKTPAELLAWVEQPAKRRGDAPVPGDLRPLHRSCPGCERPARPGYTYCDDGPCRLEARRANWRASERARRRAG